MTRVIEWPPFALTGWEIYDDYPQSRSVGVIQGNARTSSGLRQRRMATAISAGIQPDASGAGYVRMLNRQWGHEPRLTRVPSMSSGWHLPKSRIDLSRAVLEWTSGENTVKWTLGGSEVRWSSGETTADVSATPGVVNGWPVLNVVGAPPNAIIARPSDRIVVFDSSEGDPSTFAMNVARTDASGNAVIFLETAIASSGLISIGDLEPIVFEVLEVPRSLQPVNGNWFFEWKMREVYADEYPGGFEYVVPPWLS